MLDATLTDFIGVWALDPGSCGDAIGEENRPASRADLCTLLR